MTRLARHATLLVTLVIGVSCVACTSGASSRPAASSTRSSAAGDVPPPPKVGQCRNTPASNLGQADWVDQTPVVDCADRHTLETFEVIKPAEKLTLAQVKQLADSCAMPAANYLGIADYEMRTLALPMLWWPSPAQRAAGQNWVRCDVGVKATTHCCLPRAQLAPQTGSLRGQVSADPVRFQMCIDQLPDPARAQPLKSCKQPHRTEILPTLLQRDVSHYPTPEAMRRMGASDCAKLVPARDAIESLVVTPVWAPRESFSGGTLYGSCWIHRRTGLMPPIR